MFGRKNQADFTAAAAKSVATGIALLRAAEEGDAAGISKALAEGANINARGDNKATPLIIAAANGQTEAVKLLLEKGADTSLVNGFQQTALISALREHAPDEIIFALIPKSPLDLRDMHGNTAPFYAAQNAHDKLFAAMITAGADITLPGRDNITPLMQATALSHTLVVKVALTTPDCGIDTPDNTGTTPLMMAVTVRNFDNAAALVTAGANIDLRSNDGETAEDIAKRRDMPEILPLLEKAKADKYAAIHAGVKSAPMETVRFKPKKPQNSVS